VDPHDLTVKAILGGIREVTAARLSSGRARELPSLAPELTAWLGSYPRRLPAELSAPAVTWSAGRAPRIPPASERARRAEGRLPSGRSELPRPYVRKSQQERIVDAIAAIVCEKGLGALTIPEIARRANVSLETFYELYPSKDDAFLGTQKVGMHQALQVGVRAWEAAMPDWPRAIAAGMRAVVDYLVSEPAHAHLSIIDTFGASPETIEVRASIMQAFTTYFAPGYELQPAGARPPAVSAEAVVGAIWQMLHHYIDCEEIEQLPAATPQLTYLALTPFIGPERAAAVATEPR
jgi:AcrR family transcriptional regulator